MYMYVYIYIVLCVRVCVCCMQIYLGNYPNYWCLQEAQVATTKFARKMKELDKQLRERNKKLEIPYTYLLPSMIPNSITI